MKRLERGRFAELWSEGSGTSVRLTSSELALFIASPQERPGNAAAVT